MKTIRIGLAGYGRWGKFCHAALIRKAPGLELAAVVSSNPEKRQAITEDLGVPALPDFESLLADSTIDAVAVITPNATHAPLAIRALEAGKHVVTDKVMCLSTAEFERMEAASKASGKLLTVFHNRRLDGDFLTLSGLIGRGELGDLRWVELAWQGFGAWGGWRGEPEQGGGRLYDLGSHLLDQLLLLFPSPVQSVYCRMRHDFSDAKVESEAFVLLTFANGQTGICDVSGMAAISKPRFYARGTAGTFQKYGLDPQEDALMKGDIDTAVENPETYGRLASPAGERIVPTEPGRWRDYYENFAQAVHGEAPPLVTLPEMRRLLTVFDAARKSAVTGEVMSL